MVIIFIVIIIIINIYYINPSLTFCALLSLSILLKIKMNFNMFLSYHFICFCFYSDFFPPSFSILFKFCYPRYVKVKLLYCYFLLMVLMFVVIINIRMK